MCILSLREASVFACKRVHLLRAAGRRFGDETKGAEVNAIALRILPRWCSATLIMREEMFRSLMRRL